MSDFVEQCRQEWRRLGVPDPLAEEMAADLASDLREAEAEGVSAEELLGSSVFDPRSFAASWAAERGIIPAPPSRGNARRRPLVLVAFTALAAITLIVAALLLLTGQPKVSLVASRTTTSPSSPPPAPSYHPAPAGKSSTQAHPPRSSGSCCSSRSSRSASLHGCGRGGAARDHPPPRLATSRLSPDKVATCQHTRPPRGLRPRGTWLIESLP